MNRYIFDGDFDKLEYILLNKVDDYSNITIHLEPIHLTESITDMIKDGQYYRLTTDEQVTISDVSYQIVEMIPCIAGDTEYHVVGVPEQENSEDLTYFAVPCVWSPKYGRGGRREPLVEL